MSDTGAHDNAAHRRTRLARALILSTVGIDTDCWDELYPTWSVAIVRERVTRENTTARLEWDNLVAIVERGHPIRRFR